MGGGNTSPRVLCFPMHHKKLLLAVLGIVVFVTASYFVVSPYVRNVMEEEESMYALRNKQNPSSTTEIEVEDLESENDLSKEAESENEDIVVTPPVVAKPMKPIVTTPSKSTPAPAPVPKPVEYTEAKVATHNDAESCWTIINGNVYDLTSFVSRHPGGERNILKICGTDGTEAFMSQHGGDARPENILVSLLLGPLTP